MARSSELMMRKVIKSVMSASLESLMLRNAPQSLRPSLFGALFAFVGIGASGAVAFVVLSTVMITLLPMAQVPVVNAACYAATILPVYVLHRRFSFDSDASHWQALPRYVAVQCMALVLAALFSFVVHGYLQLPTVFASILVIGLTSGVNFVVLRSWAFARGQMGAAVAA